LGRGGRVRGVVGKEVGEVVGLLRVVVGLSRKRRWVEKSGTMSKSTTKKRMQKAR
jgi:hypothetical protein